MTTHDPAWGENGRPARRLLRRQEASAYLAEHWGIVLSPATFAKYAVTGGGPRYYKAGPYPLYPPEWLDEYARELLGEPVASTSATSKRG